MPAIDLSRLRTRIKLLKEQTDQPELFVRSLREIYEIYADPTQRMGWQKPETVEIPEFRTPVLLNQELELALKPLCQDFPENTLAIIDRLWQQPEIEIRQLSASLLGKIPITSSHEVMARMEEWSNRKEDDHLLPFLHLKGSETLRMQSPEIWLDVLQDWKNSNDPWQTVMALQGLIPLIQDSHFSNLPAIYTFLFDLVLPVDPEITFDIQTVILELINRSEIETVYFLKQVISASKDPGFGRFLRQILPNFTDQNQISLKAALKDHSHLG